jgi:pyruvate/2-oxoglutarate dehydrogenase complex dihydrolipoamide acyltransferase (E2) component
MPEIGAGAQPLRIVQWLVEPGTELLAGDRVVEIATVGVLFSVSSPWSGTLVQQLRPSDATVRTGEPLATIDVSDDDA